MLRLLYYFIFINTKKLQTQNVVLLFFGIQFCFILCILILLHSYYNQSLTYTQKLN